jgi:fused signal recognition particle receptor
VKFVGLGEKMDDLQEFDPEQYVYGLFADLLEEPQQ